MRLPWPALVLAACSSGPPSAAPPPAAAVAPTPDRAAGEPASALEVCSPEAFCIENPRPVGGALQAVWAADRAHVWAVGEGGVVLRFDGARWRLEHHAEDDLRALGGSSTTDVWAGGQRLELLHRDTAGWRAVELEPPDPVERHEGWWSLAAVDPREQILGTLDAILLRRDGAWSVLAQARLGSGALAERGHAAAFVGRRVVLRRADGTYATETLPMRSDVRALFVLDAVHAWATGDHGELLRRDEAGWHLEPAGYETPFEVRSFDDVAARAPDDVWAVSGEGRVVHFDGRRWADDEVPWELGAERGLHRLALLDDGRVLVAGGLLAVRERDGRWTHTAFEHPTFVLGLARTGPGEAWAVGTDGTIAHFDGVGWQRTSAGIPGALAAIHAAGPDRVHAVGNDVWARRREGGRWEAIEGAPRGLRDVLVRDRDAIAIGLSGTMARWTDGVPARIETGTDEELVAIVEAGDRVRVATRRRVLELEGDRLVRPIELPDELVLASMIGLRSGEVVIGTDGGGVLRLRDGRLRIDRRERFDPETLEPLSPRVSSWHEAPDGVLWGAAREGVVRLEGTRLEHERIGDEVTAVTSSDGALWAVGERVWRREEGGWAPVRAGLPHDVADACTARDGTMFLAGRGPLIARRATGAR